MTVTETLGRKVLAGGQLTKKEAMTLYGQPLEELCTMADTVRARFHAQAFSLCTIVNGKLASKTKPPLPKKLVNVISCKNPRCITSAENVDQIFTLCDEKAHRYRCIYCEQEYKK